MRLTSKGICRLCQGEFSKPGMTRHLETCWQRTVVGEQAEGQKHLRQTHVFHLVVEGYRLPRYWLHLEVATSTTLEALDSFLRNIWLECCGHLSAFEIGGVRYREEEESLATWRWGPPRQSMKIELGKVLSPGQTCTYEYDFGSTTELKLKVVAAREVQTRGTAIQILARNTLPPEPCDLCGKPATCVCRQYLDKDDEKYLDEDDKKRYLCSTCAETYEYDKGDLVPLQPVNSPRAGVCGYRGPTNPMYL
jgi:Plasmid pRiA4b ORF-3-like protein